MESYNNTNHATVAVVDDLLHGILEFQLALFSDGSNFRGDAVIHQLFHSLAEDISLPDTVLRLRLIDKMDQIHNEKTAAFQSTIDSYMDQAKAIQDSSSEGVKALNEVLSVWEKQIKPAREACEESKNELIRLGEDVSDLDEELDQLEIEEKDVKSLISCLEYNGQTAKAFETYVKELKKIPQNLKSLSVDSTEGSYVINQGETDAINLFWNSHSDILQTDYMNFTFQDASTEKFYTEVLQKVGEESEDEDAKGKQQEKKQEAKDASNSYSDLLNTLKNQDSKDLKKVEGMTYPDDFPSGIAGATAESGTGKSSDSIDTDDEKMVDKLTKSDGFTEKFSAFLNGLDQWKNTGKSLSYGVCDGDVQLSYHKGR